MGMGEKGRVHLQTGRGDIIGDGRVGIAHVEQADLARGANHRRIGLIGVEKDDLKAERTDIGAEHGHAQQPGKRCGRPFAHADGNAAKLRTGEEKGAVQREEPDGIGRRAQLVYGK